MLNEFLVGGLLTLLCGLACEGLYLGAVALRSILFGIIPVYGRVPLPQMDFVRGCRVESRQNSGCSFRGLGMVPAFKEFFLLGICALPFAGPCDGAQNCKAVDLRDITLTIENSSRLDSGSFAGSFHLFLHGLRIEGVA